MTPQTPSAQPRDPRTTPRTEQSMSEIPRNLNAGGGWAIQDSNLGPLPYQGSRKQNGEAERGFQLYAVPNNVVQFPGAAAKNDPRTTPQPPALMTLDEAAAELAKQLEGREVWDDLDDVTRQRYRHILGLMPDRGSAA